jgi:hypothetical protein
MFPFFGAAKPPPTIASDKIVRLNYFDDSPVWRSWILYSLFVFDEALDVDRLHSSLTEVIKSKGWEKLGARLRKDVRLELPFMIRIII